MGSLLAMCVAIEVLTRYIWCHGDGGCQRYDSFVVCVMFIFPAGALILSESMWDGVSYMSQKFMSFLAMCWFIWHPYLFGLEGAYFGLLETSIINDLGASISFSIGNLLVVPVFNINFVQGIVRILLWDYSFYTGGWEIIRWFWVCTLSSAAVWGTIQSFIWLYGQALSLFNLF